MKNNIFKIRENFVVNKDGTVRDKETNVLLQTYTSRNGDVFVLLQIENSVRLFPTRIDILVLSKFTKRPSRFHLPYHIDGNKLNNELSNLVWVENLEEWRQAFHPKHNFVRNYEVSSFGNIRELTSDGYRPLNIFKHKEYLMVRLYTVLGVKIVALHQIVCATFNSSYSDDKIVNHIDGFKNNNVYFNLEYVTKRENEIHAGIINLRPVRKINDSDTIIVEDLLRKSSGSCQKVYNYLSTSGLLPNVTIYDIKRIKRRMNPNLFERLHGDYLDEKHKLIAEVLKQTNGRVQHVVDIMRKQYNIDTTESVVHNVKRHMDYKFPEINKSPMSNEEIEFIRNELIRFNGHIPSVYNNVVKKFPRIRYNDIGTIKIKMRNEGIHFPNGKTNIKITDSQRSKLIQLLQQNELSPSKTFDVIKDNSAFKNVTIYDLKYLKRKYLKDLNTN